MLLKNSKMTLFWASTSVKFLEIDEFSGSPSKKIVVHSTELKYRILYTEGLLFSIQINEHNNLKNNFFKLQPYPFIIFMKSIKMSSWNRFLKVDIINNIKKVLEFEEIDLSHSHHPSVFDILSLTENFCQDQRCVLTEWSSFRVYFHFACFFLMLLTRTIKLCNVMKN